jgi:hypothetical protein
MKQATTYNPLTGEIQGTIQSSEDIHADTINGRSFIEGEWHPLDYYVLDGVATPRPEMSCQVDGKRITEIPAGATLYINQSAYVVTDGEAVLSSDQRAKLPVSVALFPFKPFTTEIDFAN